MEELLAAGTLLLLLLLPSRLAKPGPASAPRPPVIRDMKPHSPSYSSLWRYMSALQLFHMLSKKVRTNPPESSRSNELHELVVAHVTQKALQAALPFTQKTEDNMWHPAWKWNSVSGWFLKAYFRLLHVLRQQWEDLLPPRAERSCPPLPPLPRAPGIGGLLRYSFTLRQCSSSLSVLGS